MILKNQNSNQTLISEVNELSKRLKAEGKDPRQIVMNMLSSGQISRQQLEDAKNKAQCRLGLFGKS